MRIGVATAALALCSLLGRPAAAEEGAVTVKAVASKEEVTVAEAFVVEIEARGPAGTTFTFPPMVTTESVELGPVPPPSPAPGSGAGGATPEAAFTPGRHRYEARVFGLGEVKLPAVEVGFRRPDGTEGVAASEPLTVKVGSLLPKDTEEQRLADIRGPVGVGVAPVFWAALGLALLVVVGAAFLVWRRMRRPRMAAAEPPAPDVPPAEEALRALEKLARESHFARGDGRGYYIALAGIAKRYLERRLGAPIVEMTSSEMLAHLRDSPHGGELVAPMRDLAGAADQVKFAKGEALREEGERHLESVRALVGRLESRLAPPPPLERGEAGTPTAGRAA